MSALTPGGGINTDGLAQLQGDVNALKVQVQKWVDDGVLPQMGTQRIIWNGLLDTRVTEIKPAYGAVKQAEDAYLVGTSYYHCVASTTVTFDMTNWKALKVRCRMTVVTHAFAVIGCSKSPVTEAKIDDDSHVEYVVWADVNSLTEKTYVIDVSSLTGDYFISFGLSNHGSSASPMGDNLRLFAMWLE